MLYGAYMLAIYAKYMPFFSTGFSSCFWWFTHRTFLTFVALCPRLEGQNAKIRLFSRRGSLQRSCGWHSLRSSNASTTCASFFGGGITPHFLWYVVVLMTHLRVKVDFHDYFLDVLIKCTSEISSFTSIIEAQAGLPPRFCVGRKSTVNDLCSRLHMSMNN